MQVASLTVNNYDIMLAVLWGLIALHNSKSLIMLLTLLAYLLIQSVTTTNFQAFIVISSAYFYFAQLGIKNLSSFRRVFLCFGVVYFLGAIDQSLYYHLDVNTFFDRIQPYLITIINAYAMAGLIGGGGRQDAGFVDYIARHCVRWSNGLSLLQTSSENHKR